MIAENITSLIPQKPPFVMVDKLLHVNQTSTRTGFRIQGNNIFVEEGLFNESGILENIAQTAAAGAGYIHKLENKIVPIGFIGSIKNFEIIELPKINDEIITEVKITNQIFNVTIICGELFCNNKLLAKCEMKIVLIKS